jgi:hypothetical protein
MTYMVSYLVVNKCFIWLTSVSHRRNDCGYFGWRVAAMGMGVAG